MPWVLVAGGSSDGACRPSQALWWSLGGLWTEMGGACGARSRLVDFSVMHRMVIDETLHVFPGSGVGELFRVCQQGVFAVYHFGGCCANCFWLEVRCCLHRVPSGRGEPSVSPGVLGCVLGCLCGRARGRDVGWGWGNGMMCQVRYLGRPPVPSPGSNGALVWVVCVGGVCGFSRGWAPGGSAGA